MGKGKDQGKLGPGEYRKEGCYERVEDLPAAKVVKQEMNYSKLACPECGRKAARDRVMERRLHDIGDLVSGRPREIELRYSQHHCRRCNKYFRADQSGLAGYGSHYTVRVVGLAVRLVVEDGLAYRNASWQLWRDHRVFVPFATIQNWVEAGGKKSQPGYRKGLSGVGIQRL